MIKNIVLSFAMLMAMPVFVKAKEIPDIQVAVLNQYPFVIVKDKAVVSGLLVEKMKVVARKAGYNAKFIPMPSAGRLLHSVEYGKVDAALAIFYSKDRAKKYHFVKTPLYEHSVIALLDKKFYATGINNLSELNKGKVGFVRDFYLGKKVSDFIKAMDENRKLPIMVPRVAMHLIRKNRIKSFISDFEVARQTKHVAYRCGKDDYIVSKIDYVPSYIALHKGHKQKAMSNKLAKAVTAIDASGESLRLKEEFWAVHPNDLCSGFSQ